MKKKVVTFSLTLALWLVFAGRLNIEVFLLGAIICSIVSLMFAESLFKFVQLRYGTKDLFFKIYYICLVAIAFIYDVFLSAFRVSRHAFVMKPSFSPQLVKINTSLKHSSSIAILANFITLPQGTLALDFDQSTKDYIIHWIESDDQAEEKKARISKHEKLLSKVFNKCGV